MILCWYLVAGTSNNGCTFCLRSSCYTGLTRPPEEWPALGIKNGRGSCGCQIKQIYITSSFVVLAQFSMR